MTAYVEFFKKTVGQTGWERVRLSKRKTAERIRDWVMNHCSDEFEAAVIYDEDGSPCSVTIFDFFGTKTTITDKATIDYIIHKCNEAMEEEGE